MLFHKKIFYCVCVYKHENKPVLCCIFPSIVLTAAKVQRLNVRLIIYKISLIETVEVTFSSIVEMQSIPKYSFNPYYMYFTL